MITPEEAKARIDVILAQYQDAKAGTPTPSLVPAALTAGKLYEAWVLCEVLSRLSHHEGFQVELQMSDKVTLKSSPGPINRRYPHFTLTPPSGPQLEVWTDVEFTTLSHTARGGGLITAGDYHELDIVVVPSGSSGRPAHSDVLIGVESKNTVYSKALLREVLGVRRELSYLQTAQQTPFTHWPRSTVPMSPPSCLLVYASDPGVTSYASPATTFGVDFVHFPPP